MAEGRGRGPVHNVDESCGTEEEGDGTHEYTGCHDFWH